MHATKSKPANQDSVSVGRGLGKPNQSLYSAIYPWADYKGAISLRSHLAQDEEPGLRCREARGKGRLGAMITAQNATHVAKAALCVVLALVVIVILILAFAHAWAPGAAPDLSKRCFETFGTAQWPKWIGCAIAVHESLAAGLIGAGGALFAAWLAYSTVQQQFAHLEAERARLQAEAKETAVVSLVQIVHAAGSTLRVVRQALEQDNELGKKRYIASRCRPDNRSE